MASLSNLEFNFSKQAWLQKEQIMGGRTPKPSTWNDLPLYWQFKNFEDNEELFVVTQEWTDHILFVKEFRDAIKKIDTMNRFDDYFTEKPLPTERFYFDRRVFYKASGATIGVYDHSARTSSEFLIGAQSRLKDYYLMGGSFAICPKCHTKFEIKGDPSKVFCAKDHSQCIRTWHKY